MKKPILVVLWLFVSLVIHGYEWPFSDVKTKRIFGQKEGSRLWPGVELETSSLQLTAPETGELLFFFQPQERKIQDLPSSLKSGMVLTHEDNLRVLISNVIPLLDRFQTRFHIGEPLGQPRLLIDDAVAQHRVFVFDHQLNEVVNPFFVFPVLEDKHSPVIVDVKISPQEGGPAFSLFSRSNFTMGYWTVFLNIFDPVSFKHSLSKKNARSELGIYCINIYLNGAQVFTMSLNSFQEKDGQWFVKGLNKPLEDFLIKNKEWKMSSIFLSQGTNILEVIVQDFSGNKADKTFHLMGSRA